MKLLVRLAAVTVIAAPLIIGASTPANASTYSQCTDKYQVGSTGYIDDFSGNIAASVKQYWSPMCAQNFAYVYVWQSFRDTHASWSVEVEEVYDAGGGNNYVEGKVSTPYGRGSDFWSLGYSGAGKCTSAVGYLNYGTSPVLMVQGTTDERCG